MPSPHQVITLLLAEVWPDRVGIASDVASGILHRLNEAGYTISIMGELRFPPAVAAERMNDPPKTFRVDRWTPGCASLEEYVAGISDYQVAMATFDAAVLRWPRGSLTLRQGTRVVAEAPVPKKRPAGAGR